MEKEMRKPLRRVVSLSPSITANLFFLGLGSMVVGVTEQCLLPEESEDRERIGSFAFPDPEKIASLRPDLVVAQGRIHDPYLKALKDRNISTFRSSPKTVADIFQELETLCALVGQVEPGSTLLKALRQRVEKVKRSLPGRVRPRVFRLMTKDPLFTPTSSSFQYDAILLAGGRPLEIDSETPYAQVSLEEVISFNPEAILSCGRSKKEAPPKRCPGCKNENPPCQRVDEEIKGWEGWKEIEAVRKGRILTLPCQSICWPGPRLVDGIERMAHFFRNIWDR